MQALTMENAEFRNKEWGWAKQGVWALKVHLQMEKLENVRTKV